jgi:hypothetical protein
LRQRWRGCRLGWSTSASCAESDSHSRWCRTSRAVFHGGGEALGGTSGSGNAACIASLSNGDGACCEAGRANIYDAGDVDCCGGNCDDGGDCLDPCHNQGWCCCVERAVFVAVTLCDCLHRRRGVRLGDRNISGLRVPCLSRVGSAASVVGVIIVSVAVVSNARCWRLSVTCGGSAIVRIVHLAVVTHGTRV